MDAFIVRDVNAILALITDNATLVIPDQTGTIPYSGVFVGKQAVVDFLLLYASFVIPVETRREDTYSTKDNKKVIVTVFTDQINRLVPLPAPDPVATTEFSAPLDFIFTFDKRQCLIESLYVNYETGPLVLFYSQPLVTDESSEPMKKDTPSIPPCASPAKVVPVKVTPAPAAQKIPVYVTSKTSAQFMDDMKAKVAAAKAKIAQQPQLPVALAALKAQRAPQKVINIPAVVTKAQAKKN